MRVGEPELVEQVERLLAQQKTLERQMEQLKSKWRKAPMGELETQAHDGQWREGSGGAARWHGPVSSCARWPIRFGINGSRR